ncbi:Golgi membrane exchange factor (Ric1p-Rgp1p) subunit, partial [Coemansia interrupta]
QQAHSSPIHSRGPRGIQMGLTITATFERQGIYFAGETLECHIRFSNERSTQTLSAAAASAEGSSSRSSGSGAAAAVAAALPPPVITTVATARDARRRSTAQQPGRRHRGTVGLAAFPSLDDGSGDSSSAQRAARASSAVSTPTSSFSSWLPFGARPQQQAQLGLQTARRRPTHSTASDAGSSGLLGSLWRNLSGAGGGGSSGALAEGDAGVERLAIGLAEAAGTMALSPAYVGREALEQLVRHGGTDFGPAGARAAPVGGGLGGWVPGAAGGGGGRAHKTLPLLAASPAVLFSELALAPGDSQTFSLRIDLPAGLAPSFRGRAACIAYDVVVVAKRSMLDASAHVARIPFRVLAAVPPDGATPVFALERPLRLPPGSVRLVTQEGAGGLSSAESLPLAGDDPDEPGGLDGPDSADALYGRLARSPFLQALLRDAALDAPAGGQNVPALDLAGAPGGASSQANIVAACRRRAPVAFSLSQGAHTPASVWLPRRTYQLGDMVAGRVDFHAGAQRVYHISLWLETTEAVGRRYANYGAAQTEELTRKVVAEHHGFCRANRSLGFALPTPPAAAPSFDSPLVANVWQLRIELITAAAAHAAPDLALSAATPFPPSMATAGLGRRRRSSSSSGTRPPLSPVLAADGEAASVLSLSPPPLSPVLAGPPPITPLFGSPASAPPRAGRMRSSTVVGHAAAAAAVPPQPSPTAGRHSLDSHHLPAAARASADHSPRTIRRRYDVAAEVPTQTLSCTVPIQMHPSLASALRDSRKDSYTIDLTTSP